MNNMAGFRKKKLEQQVKKVVGEALIREVKDPRIGFSTVYDINLADDYSHAEILISVLGDDSQKRKTLKGLNAAKGFIRSYIGKNIRLRHVPEITFKIDTTVEEGVDLVNLIESVNPEENDNTDEK